MLMRECAALRAAAPPRRASRVVVRRRHLTLRGTMDGRLVSIDSQSHESRGDSDGLVTHSRSTVIDWRGPDDMISAG